MPKKVLCIILVILSVLVMNNIVALSDTLFIKSNFDMSIVRAQSTTNFYAQIQNTGVYLESEPFGTLLFEIPSTYYVKLLEAKENGYYKVQYLNLTGYVLDDKLQCVANIPTTPYLDYVNFRNFGSQSSELRSQPNRQGGISTLLCQIPLYETNFIYYGKISGEEVVTGRSNVWYYACYQNNNERYFGYLYSGLIDMMTSYTNLKIDSSPIAEHDWSSVITNPRFEMPSQTQIMIILALTVPILLVVVALFKPTPKVISSKSYNQTIRRGKNTRNEKERIWEKERQDRQSGRAYQILKRKRGKDYYEM